MIEKANNYHVLSLQREPCNTMLLNNLLEPKSYGIAMQRDSPHTKRFSVAILQVSLPLFILFRTKLCQLSNIKLFVFDT